jgi:molecular chaperone GrpE
MSEPEGREGRRHPARGGSPPPDGEVGSGAPRPDGAGAAGAPPTEPGGGTGPAEAAPLAEGSRPEAEAAGSRAGPPGEEGGAAAEDEVGALRRDLAERNDQLLRLAADFENFRRRKNQELSDRARYAAEEATRALLPVLDNLRRAVDHAPQEAEAAPGNGSEQLHEGLRMVVLQFEQALRQIGVEPVETVGAAFDPSIHEAIGGEESDDVERDTVIAEMQPGYRLHDRLIRPALVRIAHPRHRRGA